MKSMENKTGSRISEADGESQKSSELLLDDLNVEGLVNANVGLSVTALSSWKRTDTGSLQHAVYFSVDNTGTDKNATCSQTNDSVKLAFKRYRSRFPSGALLPPQSVASTSQAVYRHPSLEYNS